MDPTRRISEALNDSTGFHVDVVAPLGVIACVFIMVGLPYQAWERFALWLVVGLLLYGFYGFKHSKLRQAP